MPGVLQVAMLPQTEMVLVNVSFFLEHLHELCFYIYFRQKETHCTGADVVYPGNISRVYRVTRLTHEETPF